MKDNLKKLVDELIKAGKDFSVYNEQSEVSIFMDDYSLVLNANGKWRLE